MCVRPSIVIRYFVGCKQNEIFLLLYYVNNDKTFSRLAVVIETDLNAFNNVKVILGCQTYDGAALRECEQNGAK